MSLYIGFQVYILPQPYILMDTHNHYVIHIVDAKQIGEV